MDVLSIFDGKTKSEFENIIRFVKIDKGKHKEGFFNILKYYEPKFEIIPENESIINTLRNYFSGQECSLSLSKGIAIFGGVGTGKTLLFKALKDYTREVLQNNSFISHSAKSIIDNVNINGVESIETLNFILKKPTTLYIDDIASTNEIVNHFGTKINAIESLLSLRYDIFKRYRKLTHITSNKYPSELVDIYGERVIDRMREMFNIIELNCKSFRK